MRGEPDLIIDEHGLTWRQTAPPRIDQRYGGECIERTCVQHPRVTQLVQRPNREADWVTTYVVDGIQAQYWHTAAEAIAAMRANP